MFKNKKNNCNCRRVHQSRSHLSYQSDKLAMTMTINNMTDPMITDITECQLHKNEIVSLILALLASPDEVDDLA